MTLATDFLNLLSDTDALQLMLFACPDGLVVTDPEERVLLYAGASEQIFGFQPIEVLHQPVSALFADAGEYRLFRDRLVKDGRVVNMEVAAERKESGPFAAAISAAILRDRFGATVGSVMYIRDHTEARSIQEALRRNNRRLNDLVRTLNHIAQHDQLTGMFYRASAIQAAEAALHTSGDGVRPLGVALFDLDHFKRVNDNFGHFAGDEVLATIANVLSRAARPQDIIGRFGGEEFIAFLPGAGIEETFAFAEEVRKRVAEVPSPVGADAEFPITVSAGVAAIPACAATLENAIRCADDRLLRAKRQGRNRSVATDEETEQPAA